MIVYSSFPIYSISEPPFFLSIFFDHLLSTDFIRQVPSRKQDWGQARWWRRRKRSVARWSESLSSKSSTHRCGWLDGLLNFAN